MCTTEDTEGSYELTYGVLGCAFAVHRELGPGLLESAYEQCLAHELAQKGFEFEVQVPLPLKYKDIQLDCGFRIDLLVEECLVLELKAVDRFLGIHEAQILTYMKLAKMPVGLLINFNCTSLKNGIKRFKL